MLLRELGNLIVFEALGKEMQWIPVSRPTVLARVPNDLEKAGDVLTARDRFASWKVLRPRLYRSLRT